MFHGFACNYNCFIPRLVVSPTGHQCGFFLRDRNAAFFQRDKDFVNECGLETI